MRIKFVNYQDYAEIRGQQNIKNITQSFHLAMTLPASNCEHSTCLREYRLKDQLQLIAPDGSDVATRVLNAELILLKLLTIQYRCWDAVILRDTLIWISPLHLRADEKLQ